MKFKHVIMTLGLAAVLGLGVGAGLKAGQVKEAEATGTITVYFAGVGEFGPNVVNIGLDGTWKVATATTGSDKLIGQWKAEFTADSGSALNAYMKENDFTYWHPDSGDGVGEGDYWNTDYSVITSSGSFQAGKKYIITYTGFNHGHDNNQHKWFDFSLSGYSITTIYCLDKSNSLLETTHNAHVWGPASSDWPGVEMNTGSHGMYNLTLNAALTNIVFTNVNDSEVAGVTGTNKTADLSIIGGQCFVLESDWSGKWVSESSGSFVANYMKFDSYGSDQYVDELTLDCDANYSAAKTAYNALANNTVRKEVLNIPGVADRLGWWARAHGETLDLEGAQLSNVTALTVKENNDSTLMIVVISIISITLVAGGFFFIRKRKEDR